MYRQKIYDVQSKYKTHSVGNFCWIPHKWVADDSPQNQLTPDDSSRRVKN